MTKAKRIIKGFDFTGKDAHVALVDEAANGQTVLVMKSLTASEEEVTKALSKDVSVKMTIMEFLTRYLNLWWDDAEIVAGLMGYSAEDIDEGTEASDINSWVDYLNNKLSNIEINKSAEPQKFEQLIEKFDSFKSKYLVKDSTSSVDGSVKTTLEGEDVVTKAEDGKPTNEEVQMTQEEIQEMISKAAGDLAKEQVAEIEKAYEAKAEATNKELQILKAAHETRTAQEYLTKASEYAQFLGEDADKEAIAKALRTVEGIEDAAPLLQVLKALKDVAAKDDLLEEVGKSATKEQPSDIDSQVIAIAKSLKEVDPSLTQRQAEMKAYEQIVTQA